MLTISSGSLENGFYIYTIEANGEVYGNKKMIIIK